MRVLLNQTTVLFVAMFYIAGAPQLMLAQQTNTFPSSGNVGIGTTSPGAPLHVRTATGFNTLTGYDTSYNLSYIASVTDAGNVNQPLAFQASQFIFYNYNGGGNVGIGTTSPGTNNGGVGRILDVSAPGSSNSAVVLESSGPSASQLGGILEVRNPAVTLGDPRLGQIDWRRLTDVTTGRISSAFDLYVNDDGTLRDALNIGSTGNVGIGTTGPQYPLAVNGTIQAKEVVVNTGWSDYVFQPDYRLRPLNDIADYIRQNHHLPDIPSESEIHERGVSLGEMQSKLLAKIEELTLELIQEHERNNELAWKVRKLEEAVK